MKGLGFLFVFALLSGCATVTVLPAEEGRKLADGRSVIETVGVDNTDWRLFCLFPIASGNPEAPNTVSCRWFRDTVSVQSQLDMIAAEAVRCGATEAVDVCSYETEEDVFLLLFLRRKMHTSAVLVR